MTAASGMKTQQMQVDTVANNIANVNTAGFKKSELAFRDMLYQTLREPGALRRAPASMSPTGLQVGSGAEVASSLKVFRQGEDRADRRPQYDLAIAGHGFFRVQLGSGEFRYTRDGSASARTATARWSRPTASSSIRRSTSRATRSRPSSVKTERFRCSRPKGGVPEIRLTNVSLFRFPNPSGLKAQGGNMYTETASSGPVQAANPGLSGTGTIIQRAVERSNVQVVDELVALILAQRNYEVNSRAIRVSDDMLQQVNNLIR